MAQRAAYEEAYLVDFESEDEEEAPHYPTRPNPYPPANGYHSAKQRQARNMKHTSEEEFPESNRPRRPVSSIPLPQSLPPPSFTRQPAPSATQERPNVFTPVSTEIEKPKNLGCATATCLVAIAAVILIILVTGLGVVLLWHGLDGDPPEPDNSLALGSGLVLLNISQPSSIAKIEFLFDTGPLIQEYVRHPAYGGIDGLFNFSALIDYNICCATATHRFICIGSSSPLQSNALFSEAYLAEDSPGEIYLVVRTIGKEAVSIRCRMTVTVDT